MIETTNTTTTPIATIRTAIWCPPDAGTTTGIRQMTLEPRLGQSADIEVPDGHRTLSIQRWKQENVTATRTTHPEWAVRKWFLHFFPFHFAARRWLDE